MIYFGPKLLPPVLPRAGSKAGFSGVFVVHKRRQQKRGEPALSLDFIRGGPKGTRSNLQNSSVRFYCSLILRQKLRDGSLPESLDSGPVQAMEKSAAPAAD